MSYELAYTIAVQVSVKQEATITDKSVKVVGKTSDALVVHPDGCEVSVVEKPECLQRFGGDR